MHRWARFLAARDDAERTQLASEDRIMALANKTLEELSQDPATRRIARARAEAIKLYDMHLAASKAESQSEGERKGRAEGMVEGEARLLLKLLAQRFGLVPEEARARIQAATLEQLDTWADRFLTATTLDQVLAP